MKDNTTALERPVIAEALNTPPDLRMAMFAVLPPGTFRQYLHSRLASVFAKDPSIIVIFHEHSATCFSRPFHQARRSELFCQTIT